jgi:hypothetical protein
LFQKNHPFIAENSGISVNINDECTAFNIFWLFFPSISCSIFQMKPTNITFSWFKN